MARARKASSKKQAQGGKIPTPTTTSKTHNSSIPSKLPDSDPPLWVEATVRNKSNDSLDMRGALERLDAALNAISYPINSDGQWEEEEVMPAAFEVVVQKKDKRELEEYEHVTDMQELEASVGRGASDVIAPGGALFNVVVWKTLEA